LGGEIEKMTGRTFSDRVELDISEWGGSLKCLADHGRKQEVFISLTGVLFTKARWLDYRWGRQGGSLRTASRDQRRPEGDSRGLDCWYNEDE
jgi:hypothetical protein